MGITQILILWKNSIQSVCNIVIVEFCPFFHWDFSVILSIVNQKCSLFSVGMGLQSFGYTFEIKIEKNETWFAIRPKYICTFNYLIWNLKIQEKMKNSYHQHSLSWLLSASEKNSLCPHCDVTWLGMYLRISNKNTSPTTRICL